MKRNFCPGSEWLYYKIYTGSRTADIILHEKLSELIFGLLADQTITQWFFIRYRDPDPHLRLRLHCETPEKLATSMAACHTVLNELLEDDSVWNIQIDTYQREMERYGLETIEASEKLFFYDSMMVMQYLDLKPYFDSEELQLLFSFLAIDQFLEAFAFDISQKLALMDALQSAYKKESDASKSLRKAFDQQFRSLSSQIQAFLGAANTADYPEIFGIIQEKQNHIRPIAQEIRPILQIPLEDFLSSHIHMMINRQYHSQQRHYECVIYDHLHRYYKAAAFCQSRNVHAPH